MKLGVFSALFADRELEQVLELAAELGLDAIEIPAGGFAPKAHCDPESLLEDKSARARFQESLSRHGLMLSALNCSGNMLHPDPEYAGRHRQDFRRTIRLAGELELDRVIVFAGCPGDSDDARTPNWVTYTWPEYYQELLEWQWNEKLIPFWAEHAEFARRHGVEKLCFEMHPGDLVHTPTKLLQLRDAVGPIIGANLDPSHLFWQGMDPTVAVRELKEAVYHVHAKDTNINQTICARKGILDTVSFEQPLDRSWNFRTVGYGHGPLFWKEFVSTLRMVGYDYVLSIEHEDVEMSLSEGLGKAVSFLRQVNMTEPAEVPWFARKD